MDAPLNQHSWHLPIPLSFLFPCCYLALLHVKLLRFVAAHPRSVNSYFFNQNLLLRVDGNVHIVFVFVLGLEETDILATLQLSLKKKVLLFDNLPNILVPLLLLKSVNGTQVFLWQFFENTHFGHGLRGEVIEDEVAVVVWVFAFELTTDEWGGKCIGEGYLIHHEVGVEKNQG